MRTVSVSEAKARLSALLRRVRGGESVLILSRGEVVARLVPPGGSAAVRDPRFDDRRLLGLERRGLVRRPERPLPDIARLRAADLPRLRRGRGLADAVLEERAEEGTDGGDRGP